METGYMSKANLFLLYFLVVCNFAVLTKIPSREQILNRQLEVSSSFHQLITRRFSLGWDEIPLAAQRAIAHAVAFKLTHSHFSSQSRPFDFKVIAENQPTSTAGQTCLRHVLSLLHRKFKNVRLSSADRQMYNLFDNFDRFKGLYYRKNGGYEAEADRDRCLETVREQAEGFVAGKKDVQFSRDLQSAMTLMTNQARVLLSAQRFSEFVILMLGYQYLFSISEHVVTTVAPHLISAIKSYVSSHPQQDIWSFYRLTKNDVMTAAKGIMHSIKKHDDHKARESINKLERHLLSYCEKWGQKDQGVSLEIIHAYLKQFNQLYSHKESSRLSVALRLFVAAGSFDWQQRMMEHALLFVFKKTALSFPELRRELTRHAGAQGQVAKFLGNFSRIASQ